MRTRIAAVAAIIVLTITACGGSPVPEGWQAEWCGMDWPRFSLAAGQAVDDWQTQVSQHQAWIDHYTAECAQ